MVVFYGFFLTFIKIFSIITRLFISFTVFMSDKIPVVCSDIIDFNSEQNSIMNSDCSNRTNLLGLSKQELTDFFVALGEKSFRATQVMKWIYQFGVTDFNQMSNLSKVLQKKLAQVAHITPPVVKFKKFSEDGTRKWVFEVAGGSSVETVLIPAEDGKQFGRKTLCIASRLRFRLFIL